MIAPVVPYHLQAQIPDDLHAMIIGECQRDGLSTSELVRKALTFYFFGQQQLGPDAGYMQARAIATKLAHTAVSVALAMIPQTYEDAVAWMASLHPGRRDE